MSEFILWLALWAGAAWALLHIFTDDDFTGPDEFEQERRGK